MWKGSLNNALFLLLPLMGAAQPQGTLIDRTIAVVGREAILHSQLSVRVEQARQGGAPMDMAAVCGELEEIISKTSLNSTG